MMSVAYKFLILVVLLGLFLPVFPTLGQRLSSTRRSVRLGENEGTIVSPGGMFELGIFKPGAVSDRWYLGIWCKKIFKPTSLAKNVVWVANRDNPLSNSSATLMISNTDLVLLDQYGRSVWSTNLTENLFSRTLLVAELLDNGNFLLRHSNSRGTPDGILWQSFDFPTDTLLSGMKLGWDRKTNLNRTLRSWKSSDDPSTGDFLYGIERRNLTEFFIWNSKGSPVYRSGPWNHVDLSGVSKMKFAEINITDHEDQVTYSFFITNTTFYSELRMGFGGLLRRFVWTPTARVLDKLWELPPDQCGSYRKCGPNSFCDMTTMMICNCFNGFRPKDQQAWEYKDATRGCVRMTQLSCVQDGFSKQGRMKLPDLKTTIVDTKVGLEECKERCLSDCNCTAVANTDMRNSGWGCVMWMGELIDVRTYNTDYGQDLYLKLASTDLGGKKKNINKLMTGLIVGLGLLLLLSFTMFCFCKRLRKRTRDTTETVCEEETQNLSTNNIEDCESVSMEFEVIATATENFSDSNKLGQGGFGIVYKGRLLDGREIAVKRLTKMSDQGLEGFRNEVRLIARVQHINLVRLLGFCANAHENILVYEYLENSSLDTYLFDTTRSSILNWEKRYDITNGIARGLLYLHQDSRVRIVHLDVKPSNVLLDKDMIPKISDFGMAKILGRDETETNARLVVGTFGYISPEYAKYNVYSVKSDVFSFGVLLLEIVSGKKNREYPRRNNGDNLLRVIWSNWNEGKGLEMVDPVIKDPSFRPEQALRCVQIGLLCVQELPEDRPKMSSVVLMLESETEEIAQPKPPFEIGSSSREHSDCEASSTVAQITISNIEPR